MKAKKKSPVARKPVHQVRIKLPTGFHDEIERMVKEVVQRELKAPRRNNVAPTSRVAPPRDAERFSNLDAHGKPTSGEHVVVRDNKTGLEWTACPLEGGKDMNHADAMKACSAVELLGKKDWRAPTVRELLSIVDYERHDPAVDKAHFKGPYGWTWTSTPYKGNSGAAWGVFLGDGDSDWSSHDDRLHARAVRAGQNLGLLD